MAAAPGYSVTALLLLGVTVGIATGAFRIVYGVLVRPLLFQEGDPLVLVEPRRMPAGGAAGAGLNMSYPEFEDWRARSRTLSDLALSARWRVGVDTGGGAHLVDGAWVSDGFFQTLRQPLALGRPPAGGGVEEVVIGHDLWRSRFGADDGVIGRSVRVDGRAHTVVGVAPAGFRFLDQPAEIWAPLEFLAGVESRDARRFTCVGRLRVGAAIEEARAEAEAVSRALAREYPDSNDGVDAAVTLVSERLAAPVRPFLVLVAAAAGLLLVTGSAGLGSLMAVRNLWRSGETATRVALGASWMRVARGFLAEAGFLALGGVVIGLVLWSAIAWMAGRERLSVFALDEYGRADGALVPWAVVSGGVAVAVSGLMAAVATAWHGAGGPAGVGRGGARAGRRVLRAGVVGQVAISFVLVQAAASLGLGLARLLRTDIGVSAEGVAATELVLASGRRLTRAQQTGLVDDVVDRVSALPGVQAAAASLSAPPDDMRGFFEFDQVSGADGRSVRHEVDLVAATPAYFDVLGVPLLRGRVFSEADDRENPAVVVLSESAARRFFGREDPVGRLLAGAYRTVVGVVGDVRYNGRTAAAADTLYFPLAQYPAPVVFLLTKGSGGQVDASDVAAAVHAQDRGIVVGATRSVEDPEFAAVALPSARAWSVAALALLALAQTIVGLYGTVAWSASRRTREFAVRMALGATRPGIARMVVREGALLVLAGLGLGAAGAAAVVGGLGRVLHDVAPAGPVVHVLAAVLVFLVALAGTVGPAWKAAGGDPALAFRSVGDGG